MGLSITKTEARTAAGAELIALCQSITADGILTKEEVLQLTGWLRQHRDSDLPAISYLGTTVERIVADGKVSREERRELHRAIESVLPVELRRIAAAKRKSVEEGRRTATREADARRRAEAELAFDREAEIARQNEPDDSFNFMIAGVRYEGRQATIARHVRPGMSVLLQRDPRNRFSDAGAATRVLIHDGSCLGFVPEDDAVDLAPLLDEGMLYRAQVTKLLGYEAVIPVVQVDLFPPNSSLPGLSRAGTLQSAPPVVPTPPVILPTVGRGLGRVTGALARLVTAPFRPRRP